MFIGHFGIGLAAKKLDSRPSLGTYFIAAQLLDLVWPLLLLLNIERVEIDPGNTAFTPLNFVHYPYTHGCFWVLLWSILFGIIYYLIKRNGRGAMIMAVLVMSHWVLDFITHRPDLPLAPLSATKVGLGLWNSVILTIILEVLIFVVGAYLYVRSTVAKTKVGKYSLWSLLIFLVLIYIMNILGPPPESAGPIAIVGLSQWLLVIWAYWIDRNRIPVNT